MADLFARLAARSADRALALRPLPAATRAVAGPTAGDGDADMSTPTAATTRLDNRTDRREISGPQPTALRSAVRDDPGQAAVAPSSSKPDGGHGAEPASEQVQRPGPDQRRPEAGDTTTPTTLIEAIAALDAGAVVDAPYATSAVGQPSATPTPTSAARRAPRRGERDGARQPSVVQVSIGELIVRGPVAEVSARSPEPAPTPAPAATPPYTPARGLSLHDYLQGDRSPR
jgi:hypothetical protein